MKVSRDQRFYWAEPFAFAQARARTTVGNNKVLLALILAVLLAAALIAIDPPSNPRDLSLVVLFSVAPALLIVYPGTWLLSRIPNSVLIAADRIVVGREVTPLKQVQSAIVGTTRMAGSEYRVFSFRTKDGREYMYGISGKISSEQLAQFLRQAGIPEPQA